MFTILWDNDGVLVETEGLYFRATQAVLAPVGIQLTPGAVQGNLPAPGREHVPAGRRGRDRCR